MKTVGITGGIGSGKTTVCRIFELLGVPVFYADEEAKKLYDDKKVLAKVVKALGKGILTPGKQADKKKIAKLVFSNRASLEKLNRIIHPEVQRRFLAWRKKHRGAKYVMKEAAILIESGSYLDTDHLIVVTAGTKERIERIVNRNSMSEADIRKRMKEQMSDAERVKFADTVIVNDGRHSLIQQALAVHRKLLRK